MKYVGMFVSRSIIALTLSAVAALALVITLAVNAAQITCTTSGSLVDVIAIAVCQGSYGEGIGITQGHKDTYLVGVMMDIYFDESPGYCLIDWGIGTAKVSYSSNNAKFAKVFVWGWRQNLVKEDEHMAAAYATPGSACCLT